LELVCVLALISVLMGMVVVRYEWMGARQQLISEARALGRTIENYRIKAQTQEKVYALYLDPAAGQYDILQPAMISKAALEKAEPLRKHRLPKGIQFGKVLAKDKKLEVLWLMPHGVMQEASINLRHIQGYSIYLKIDPFTKEVAYVEH